MKTSRNFTENLSVHGIRHIFAAYENKFTRIFWSLLVVSSVVVFGWNTYVLYEKLQHSPDIHVRTKQKFTSKIPFPAITLCTPMFARNDQVHFYNSFKKVMMHNFTNVNFTVREQNYLASNIHACFPNFGVMFKDSTKNRTDNNIMRLLNESFLTVPEAFINCGYKNFRLDCTKLLNRILTDRGYCYTFNLQGFNTIFRKNVVSEDFHSYKRTKIAKSMYQPNKLSNEYIDDESETFSWSLEQGYSKNHDVDSAPVKAEKGKIFSVNIFLKELNAANICPQVGNVFTYYIHLPNEIMMPFHQEHHVEFRKKDDVFLTATSYKVDDDMRHYSPQSRGCYFDGEKQLKFFKSYTKAHCEFECMTNYTLKVCGCVKFSMPRTSKTPICTIEDSQCYSDAMNQWPVHEANKHRFEITCGCLKTCYDIKYDVKFERISSGENVVVASDINNFTKSDVISRITFMFEDYEIFEFEEYAAYNINKFAADVGGLLGLFLGCSILSLIEIVYFLIEICASGLKSRFVSLRRSRRNEKVMLPKRRDMNHLQFIKTRPRIYDDVYINPTRVYKKPVKKYY